MKRIDVPLISSLVSQYHFPTKNMSDGWSGTVLDVLSLGDKATGDRLWLALREEFLSPKLLRLFAVSCARDVQHLMTDERSVRAIDVAERYAHGLATKKELNLALSEASGALLCSGGLTGRNVARDSAADAAWSTALDAVVDVMRAAAGGKEPHPRLIEPTDAQVEKLRQMILIMPEEVR